MADRTEPKLHPLAGRSKAPVGNFFHSWANATFFAFFTPGNVPFVLIYAQKGATFAPKIFEGLNVTRVFFGASTRRGASVPILTQKAVRRATHSEFSKLASRNHLRRSMHTCQLVRADKICAVDRLEKRNAAHER